MTTSQRILAALGKTVQAFRRGAPIRQASVAECDFVDSIVRAATPSAYHGDCAAYFFEAATLRKNPRLPSKRAVVAAPPIIAPMIPNEATSAPVR